MVNFRNYAVLKGQLLGEQLRIWTISGLIPNDSV